MSDDESFICHQPCPDCSSSDALAVYEKHTYCFSCQTYKHLKPDDPRPERSRLPTFRPMREFLFSAWEKPFRGLTTEVLDQYGIRRKDGEICFEYRDREGQVVARKFRSDDKTKMRWDGDPKAITGFGLHLANPKHHRGIAITEGELDAPSITLAMKGRVIGVSVPNGAQNAANFIRKHLDEFQLFPIVYVATDMDEPGEKAAKEIMQLFPAGKVRRVIFPKKDANEVLQEMGPNSLLEAVNAAKEIRPDGIKSSKDYQGLVLRAPQRTSTLCAFPYWNAKTPFFDNQLVVLVAGSGVGKTTFARSLALGLMQKGKKVGWIGLEETVDEAIFRFVGMAAGLTLHARTSYATLTDDEINRIKQADKFITGSDRLELFDHFGSLDEDSIMNRMDYMVRSLGCEFLFLDHLTILGSGLAQDTRHLDAMVTRIRSFIAATKCTVIAINHLNRSSSQTKNMEDGGVPELHDIRGSHSIVQLADTIWALGRKRGEQKTVSHCLKNRMLGRCGYAGSFVFHENTQVLDQVWDDPVIPAPLGVS